MNWSGSELTLRRAIAGYALFYSLFIGWASLRTALEENGHHHRWWLALIEMAARSVLPGKRRE